MQITLTGATGFIGTRLTALLKDAGHACRIYSRRSPDPALFAGSEAIVHLAGEPVAQRWTPEVKQRIRDSRVHGTNQLIDLLASLAERPRTLVAASAVGYYGNRGDEILTEGSGPGRGFLADTCVEWEQSIDRASALGIRVVKLRIGVVLGPGGGALQTMLPPFRAGVGGPLAGGRMWMPWIHLDDLCRLAQFCLEHSEIDGPVNGVAPNPVRNAEFTAALGTALRRPAFLPVPEFALRLLYGEMAEVVLGSQRVIPDAAKNARFRYSFAGVDQALHAILRAR